MDLKRAVAAARFFFSRSDGMASRLQMRGAGWRRSWVMGWRRWCAACDLRGRVRARNIADNEPASCKGLIEVKGDVFIRNARVWPSVEADVQEGAGILIQGGKIVRVGVFEARAGEVIDAGGRLVMPGLVQTHVHLCQAIMRGVAEDRNLLSWLRERIWPLEAAHDEETIRASARLACAEMIRGGTTAFMSFETVRYTGAAMEAVRESGLMGVVSHCLMDESGGYPPLAVPVEQALNYCDGLLGCFREEERVRLAIAPRFALSSTAENLRAAAEFARERGLLIHTHAAEQVEEVQMVRERTGLPNVEYLHSLGISGPDVCLTHCVHTEEHERRLLAETDTRVLHCPSANLKLGSGVAPIPEYLDAGLTVSLGADGAPCNNRLDGFMEMRLAGLIQKPRVGPERLKARDVVRMATENGARTLGWGDVMGRLEEGRLANLIIVDTSGWHVIPSSDPAANVVYACGADDVWLTMAAGKVLYRDGHLTGVDEEELRDDVRRQRRRLLEKAGLG